MRKLLFLAIALVVVGAAACDIGSATEYRGLWIDGWHDGMWTSAQIDAMIQQAVNGHYNVIIPQIRKKGDALYNSTYGGPSGTGEPKPAEVQPPSFDPLAYMIQEAHERGIEVHPWLCTHRVPTQTYDWFYTSHLNWLTKNQTGTLVNSEGYYLDPGVPDGEEYTVNVMLDVVRNYDIDGIQWDRIRYPAANSGYNTIAINRFQAQYGYFPAYTDATFSNWRRTQLNHFVARVYAQIMEIKPWVCVGANTWISYSSGNSSYFQDANAWMYNKWLDINVPMNYTANLTDFNNYHTDWLNRRYGRYVYSGMSLGASGQTSANACTEITYARSNNAGSGVPWGCQTYSYYHGINALPGWFTYVSASGRPYYSVDMDVPSLPWKTNPTTGIVMGRVVDASHPNDPVYHDWINRATVQLYHPGPPEINLAMYTDQTGYYVFTEVEPRSGYTITCMKAGYPDCVYTNQSVAAGQVLREDFELGYGTISSPAGAVQGPWSLISLPLKPSSNDPAIVFGGLDIDGKLWKWNKTTQSLVPYDVWDPGTFGTVSEDEGYWLQVGGPQTITYQTASAAPAQNDVALADNAWSIVGCPFLTNKVWGNAKVTQGSTTVDLRTAAKTNGWLDSVAWWWDNSSQSLTDVGLPEDWPSTEEIQPWHGYWVRTMANNLTLTLQ